MGRSWNRTPPAYSLSAQLRLIRACIQPWHLGWTPRRQNKINYVRHKHRSLQLESSSANQGNLTRYVF
jgi:hypothetical protein